MQSSLLQRAVAVIASGEAILRYDRESHIAVLSLERHARKNAIGQRLLDEIEAAIHVCSRPDMAVRCLLLESRVPGVFCAGADLKERKEMSVEAARAFVDKLRSTFTLLEDLAIPTISVMEGKALGGGMELALATDLRVAGSGATMGFPEAGLAIIPGAGGTFRAPALVGISGALELILSAEQVDATQAKEMGLVNRVVPCGTAAEAAMALAKRISQNGPVGVRAAKRAVRAAYGRPRAEGIATEQACYEEVLATEDRLEGLRAFAEKRSPRYLGK